MDEQLMDPTLFTFNRRDFGTTTLGPYRSQYEAKLSYQRLYGTWPEDAINTEPYGGSW